MSTVLRADSVPTGMVPLACDSIRRSARCGSDETLDLATAVESDYPAILQLLRAVLHQPSTGAFQSINDAPQYEPSDRLIIRRRGDLIAHLQLTQRMLNFGTTQLRAMEVKHLAALPEYQSERVGARLLETAEGDMVRSGCWVGLTHTSTPKEFRSRGWVTCSQHYQSEVNPRQFLAYLEATRQRSCRYDAKPGRSVHTRIWRVHELDELSAIYDTAIEGNFGPWVRRQSHWRWLMSRRVVCDHAFVAFERHPERATLPEGDADGPLLGYAAMRGDQIVEFVTVPGDNLALRQLLVRTCQEAIENGRSSMRLVAPVDHPAHELIVAAGGSFHSTTQFGGREFMAKVIAPKRFLRLLKTDLWNRARDARIDAGSEVELHVGEAVYRLTVNKRSVAIAFQPGCSGNVVRLSQEAFDQLLLGFVRIEEVSDPELVSSDSEHAIQLSARLFPKLPFWRPLLDDVSAR